MPQDQNSDLQSCHLPFDSSGIHFCGESCRLLFLQAGLASALNFMFAYLRIHIPLTRIFCGFRQYEDKSYSTLADTWLNSHNKIRTLSTAIFSPEQISLMVGSDDFEPYIINDAYSLSNDETTLRHEDLGSYLRIPMFKVGDAIFQLAFCSGQSGLFTLELAQKLKKLSQPFGCALNDCFMQTEEHLLPELNIGKDSAVEKLSFCQGQSRVLQDVRQAAISDATVLILGETGSGKEMVADAIEELSARHKGPYIKVNCGALTETLIDSELFGHEKGAFTGAMGLKQGYFEVANGGTIFLDEIGDLPLSMQARLLRVLDRRSIQRVGSSRTIPLDIRVIAATHRDLRSMVGEGKFREDLWYRLNVFTLHLPPLRAYRSDIPVLALYMLNEKCRKMGIAQTPQLAPQEMERLCKHNWPGNVRELEHVIERALIRSRMGSTMLPLHFDEDMHSLALPVSPGRPQPRFQCPYSSTAETAPRNLSLLPDSNSSEQNWPTLEEITESYIRKVMEKTRGKIAGEGGAAQVLGVHPNTLRARKKKNE